MAEYDFSLILSGVPELNPRVLDALYESGCDDALIGMRDRVAFADFSREAPSFREAVLSAIRDVERAGVGAVVEHVEPDELVNMSEMARRLQVSREGVRKWVAGLRGPGSFPPPVGNLTRRSPLWRWTDVVRWHQTTLGAGSPPSPHKSSAARPSRGPKRSSRQSPDRTRGSYADSQLVLVGPDIATLNAVLDLRRRVTTSEAMDLLRLVTAGGP